MNRPILVSALVASTLATTAAFATPPGTNGMLSFSRLSAGGTSSQVAIAPVDKDAEVTTLTSEGLNNADSIWSPDGQCILFYSDRDLGNEEIYSMDLDGGNQTRLTVHPSFDYYPDYSPDGSSVIFVSDRDGDYEIYTFDLTTGAVTQLTKNTGVDYVPDWSSDGSKIVFTSDRDGGDYEIYVMDADGQNQVRLTQAPGFDIYPHWSPDDTQIVFSTERSGTKGRDVWKMDANGENQVSLVSQDGSDTDAVFSPDGTKIAFSCPGIGGQDICIANASDGSDIVGIVTDPAFDDRQPVWQSIPANPVPSLCPKVAPKICGDANSDAEIKAGDALIALRRAVGLVVVCPHIRCDTDDSGVILASDAQRILRVSVGQSVDLDCPDVEPAL